MVTKLTELDESVLKGTALRTTYYLFGIPVWRVTEIRRYGKYL